MHELAVPVAGAAFDDGLGQRGDEKYRRKLAEEGKADSEEPDLYGTANAPGEYQVAEYKCADYDTAEYKSVYDK